MSRIWEALKRAERQRNTAGALADSHSVKVDETDRRKVLRHNHHVALLIYGLGADHQPFHEVAETVDTNENGCLVVLESEISCGQRLSLTNTRNQAEQEARVVHVGRRTRGKARIGVEFLKPAPEFWRPA